MKTLIMTADDGVSALVWLEMAKQHLKAERTVLAITEDSNVYQAIGTGDGLPGYDCGLLGHPDFLTFAANNAHPDQVLEELVALKKDVVVMFNMDPFELVDRYHGWQAVIDYCNAMPNELVMVSYYEHSMWPHALEQLLDAKRGGAVRALQSVDWDYVAGYRLVSAQNLIGMRRCFPGLAEVIERPVPPGIRQGNGVFAWQIINRSGTYELRLPYSQVDANTDAYPALWDVSYPLVAPERPADTRALGITAVALQRN